MAKRRSKAARQGLHQELRQCHFIISQQTRMIAVLLTRLEGRAEVADAELMAVQLPRMKVDSILGGTRLEYRAPLIVVPALGRHELPN